MYGHYYCNKFMLLISFLFFFRLFSQIRKEINSKKTEPLMITGATSHHAIRQASLKEVYTSVTNMWMGDIYNRSLRNVHLVPARMARNQDARRWKVKEMQTEKEQRGLDRRFKSKAPDIAPHGQTWNGHNQR